MVLVFVGFVQLRKINDFHRFVFALVQVPDLEVLGGVNDEEFTKPVHKAASQAAAFVVTVIVDETPIDHDNWVLGGVVPDRDWRGVLVVVDPRRQMHKRSNSNATYAMEPHENPASKYPESDIDSAVGAPKPSESSLVGTMESFLLHLKRAPDVEK